MIGFALFLAMFPAMLHTARQSQTYERASALAALEAPVTKTELEDWFWLLLSGLVALALWPFQLLWRLFCLPYADYLERFTQWVCARLGAGLPESTLPEWKEKKVPIAETAAAKAWDGEETDVVALFSAEEILRMTEAEYKRKTAGFNTKTFEQARYLARQKMQEK